MRLSRRLAVVERVVGSQVLVTGAPATYGEELARRRQAYWEIMRPTMSDEHAQLVVEAYAAGCSGYASPGANTPSGRLLNACLSAMMWAESDSIIPRAIALAMPPIVADVYLNHADAGTLHDCEDCGYRVPYNYFAACPLCGGGVGYSAFFLKHSKAGR